MKNTNTKSKVCIIANNLIRQGAKRSEAFRRAWVIVKTEIINTKIAGVTFGNRQAALERLTHYEADRISISLFREADNQHDPNAVAVIVTVADKGSYTIGYLPRKLSTMVAPLMDYGKDIQAQFQEIRGKYHNFHNYGMAVSVSI